MNHRLWGPLCIAVAAALWGLSAALAKFFFVHNMDTLTVVQTRSSFAFLILIPVALWRRDLLILSWRPWLRILPLGILGIAGANFFYYYAVDKTTVATAIILQYTAPILVALYQILFENQKASVADGVIILLVLFGGYTAVNGFNSPAATPDGSLRIDGALAGIAAAVCWAFFNIYERKLHDLSLRAKLFNALFYAALFWSFVQSPVALVGKIADGRILLSLIAFAFLSVLLPYIFYFQGLKWSGPLPAIVTANIEPVMAIFFSALIVHASLSKGQMLGALCVIIGATLFNIKFARQNFQTTPDAREGIAGG